MSNYSDNLQAVKEYRKKLQKMIGDIKDVDKKVLNKSVNYGLRYSKKNSPEVSGDFRKRWKTTPIFRDALGIGKTLFNDIHYAIYVNYGHRIKNKAGETVGYATSKKGDHLLERAMNRVTEKMKKEFEKEIKKVQKENDH